MAVLFSILFQAIHSYEHHSEKLATKTCDHHYYKDKTEVNHSHSTFEKCFVCDFNLSSFTNADFQVFEFYANNLVAHYPKFFFQKKSSFFKGCIFSLRAPPQF